MKETKKLILIIDRDLETLGFCEKILTGAGADVLMSTSAEEGLNKILGHAPHSLILDIDLEKESGFRILNYLKEKNLLKVLRIYLSVKEHSKEMLLISKKYEATGFVLKPFTNNQLVNIYKSVKRESKLPSFSPKDQHNIMKTFIPSELIKFNEVSIIIRSRIKFISTEKVEIESSFFKEMNIGKNHFKVYQKSRDITPGIYDTVVRMMGLPESRLQLLRQRQKRRI